MRPPRPGKAVKHVRIAVNSEFFSLATQAIQHDSMINMRFTTLRLVVVLGFQTVKESSELKRHLWMKRVNRTPLSGAYSVNIILTGDDIPLYNSARQMLQNLCLEKITPFCTMATALFAARDVFDLD